MARCQLAVRSTAVRDLPCVDPLADPPLHREPPSALLVFVPLRRPSAIPPRSLPLSLAWTDSRPARAAVRNLRAARAPAPFAAAAAPSLELSSAATSLSSSLSLYVMF
ncbi:hypothetical protein Scep_012480 [Stephania cephalantha]|uniref:Uncharacterized protein n=1 Tax=Stephania cephalantha TaxID=152367 RepID=A0AAP0P6I2_9MAGN